MQREKNVLKPVALGAVVFVTLALTIANETLARFGLQENYIVLLCAALVIAVLLLSSNLMLIAGVAIGVLAINLPDATLASLSLDRDIMLAALCALVLAPGLYQLMAR